MSSNEQYFVQISAAIKEIFNTWYTTNYVRGALNAHTGPQCVESVYVHKCCIDCTISGFSNV